MADPIAQGGADRVGEQLRQRKSRDRSLVLLLVGCALLMPPLAGIFDMPASIGGVPAVLIYVFVVWASLIAAAGLLSRSLADHHDSETAPGAESDLEGRTR